MEDRAEAHPVEVVISRDPLALAKRLGRGALPYTAVVVAALVLLGIIFRHQLNWGDFPTWVVAITTLLAFLAAAFAGLVAYDLLSVENERDLKAAEQRLFAAEERKRLAEERSALREADRRAQANKVVAWFGQQEVVRGDSVLLLDWAALVHNASDLPILDVRVFFYWVYDPRDGSPWTAEQRYASVNTIRVMPPGQIQRVELPDRVRRMADICDDQAYVVGIEFTDARGTRWFRDERGALHDRNAVVT